MSSLNGGVEAGGIYRLDVEREGKIRTYTVLVTETGGAFCSVVELRDGMKVNLGAEERVPLGGSHSTLSAIRDTTWLRKSGAWKSKFLRRLDSRWLRPRSPRQRQQSRVE